MSGRTHKKGYKTLAMLLSIMMAVSMIAAPLGASADLFGGDMLDIFSGYYYKNLDDGTVEITGTVKTGDLELPEKINSKKVTVIGEAAFATKSSDSNSKQRYDLRDDITSVKFPDSIREIKADAFASCTGIKELTLPSSLETIGSAAFENAALETVEFPEGLKTIGEGAFRNNAMASLKLPDSVEQIGANAFNGCAMLSDLTLPNKLETIEESTFGNCIKLQSVYIPESVKSIVSTESKNKRDKSDNFYYVNHIYGVSGSYAEEYAKSKNIPFGTTDQEFGYSEIDGGIEIDEYFGDAEEVTVPSELDGKKVISIRGAFSGMSSVKKVNLPDTLKKIGDDTFYDSGISEIAIPDSVTEIGQNAFEKTTIKSVVLPESLEKLGASAFAETELGEIDIPENIKRIEGSTFAKTKLKEVTVPKNIEYIGERAFSECEDLAIVNYNAENASISVMAVFSFLTKNMGAFYGDDKLKEVVVGDGVTDIPDHLFMSCTSIKKVTIPKSVESIGSETFELNDDLTIYGYTDSYAESFANDNNIAFVALDGGKKDSDTNSDKKDSDTNSDKKDSDTNSDKKDSDTNSDKKDSDTNSDKKDSDTGSDKKDSELDTDSAKDEPKESDSDSSNDSGEYDSNPESVDNLGSRLMPTSFLCTSDNGFVRVFYDGSSGDNGRIGIEYYDDDLNIMGAKDLEMELPMWGGFFKGADAYYLVEGQMNKKQDNSAEVIRVIKYDFNWNRLGAAKVTGDKRFGGQIRTPFRHGCAEMAEHDGTLFLVTGHEGYVDERYGQGHQGFLMIAVDEKDMTGKIVGCDLWHSFSQHITDSGSDLYVLEESEGDGQTVVTHYNADDPEKGGTRITLLNYGGDRSVVWSIPTYATADAVEVSSKNVLSLGTSIDQTQYDNKDSNTPYNIYLGVTPIDNFSTDSSKLIWLTDNKDNGCTYTGASITKIADDKFLVSWEENGTKESVTDKNDLLTNHTMHYVFIDGDGNKVSEELTFDGAFSDCRPVFKDSRVVFCASSGRMVDFYIIDVNSGEFDKKVYRIAGKKAQWRLDDDTLVISGSGEMSSDNNSSYYYSKWGDISSSVRKIVVEGGITGVPENEFSYFEQLEEVVIEDGVKSIGDQAFANTSIEKITIPRSVTEIGSDILWSGWSTWGGDNLTTATIYGYKGSAAEKYAEDNNITFVALDEESDTDENSASDVVSDADTSDSSDTTDTTDTTSDTDTSSEKDGSDSGSKTDSSDEPTSDNTSSDNADSDSGNDKPETTDSDKGAASSDTSDSDKGKAQSDTDKKTDSDNGKGDSTSDSEKSSDGEKDADGKENKGIIGDVDQDGFVNSNDALLVLRISLMLEQLLNVEFPIADINNDTKIDSADALEILRYGVNMSDNQLIGKPLS